MTDREAGLRAVLLDPADDTPRLVYADYLDENGEPERAEFVRVQCELAGFDAAGAGLTRSEVDRYIELHDRELALLKGGGGLWQNRDEWAGPATNIERPGRAGAYFFGRGFVESITCPLAAFLAHTPAIFAAHPVTAVRLTDREPHQHDREIWAFLGPPPSPNGLPADLYDCLVGPYGSDSYRWYATSDAALSALSAACLSFGRSAAGLPPLRVAAGVGR